MPLSSEGSPQMVSVKSWRKVKRGFLSAMVMWRAMLTEFFSVLGKTES